MAVRFLHYCNSVSPHQLPLARELAKRLGAESYRYVYTTPMTEGRRKCGWAEVEEPWIVQARYGEGVVDEMLENCDILLSGLRVLDLFEKRAAKGLKTYYQAERWFKPISIGVGQRCRCRCSVPGRLRMLVPSYSKMVKRFVRWMNSDPNARCLSIGPWAKKDMLRIGVDESKIVPWGYFVAPSAQQSNNRTIEQSNNLKVLWVGRMVYLKRVDTIIRAVAEVEKKGGGGERKILLTLVGDGPEKPRLRALVNRTIKQSNNRTITFLPSQPIEKIREIMRAHNVFVFASNAIDGWGAVVSEALEEGLKVIGTFETGASAAMLADDDLFHAGDWKSLSEKLAVCLQQKMAGELRGQGIGEWSAEKAVDRLMVGDGVN